VNLCDFVDVHHDEKIRVVGDIAAAAAGLAIFVRVVGLAVEAGRFRPAPAAGECRMVLRQPRDPP